MASFEDVTAVMGQWTNISAAVGELAGVNLNIQNKSGFSILVETRVGEPPSPSFGLERSPQGFAAAEPAAGEFVWVYAINANAKLNVQVAS